MTTVLETKEGILFDIVNDKITVSENNHEECEKELSVLCKKFEDKWGNLVTLYNSSDEVVNLYVNDTKFVFKVLDKVYGNTEVLADINKSLTDPDETEDDKEEMRNHLKFLKDVNVVINTTEISEFKNENSNVNKCIVDCLDYLKKVNENVSQLNDSMKELNSRLKLLTEALESIKTNPF